MGLSLIAKLGLDGKAFDTGLSRAQQRTRRFGSAIKGQLAAAFGTAALVGLTKKSVEFADKVNDLARKTGVSTTKIQEFAFAAAQSGTSIDTVANSFVKIQDAQGKAMTGTLTTVEAFQRLGFSMQEVQRMDAVTIFEQLARKFKDVKPTAQDVSDLFLIMGKSGKENFRLLTEGLEDMQQAAHKAGAIMDKETIQQVADMKDEFAAFMQTMMPAFTKIATFAMDAAENVTFGLKTIWQAFSDGFMATVEGLGNAYDLLMEGKFSQAAKEFAKSGSGFNFLDKASDALVDQTNKFEERQSSKEQRRIAKADAAHRQAAGLQQFERLQTLLDKQQGVSTNKISKPAVDAMAKMGLFVGGRQDPILKKADRQISELEKANGQLAVLNKQIQNKL